MHKNLILLSLAVSLSFFSPAGESLDYFLPADIKYNPEIPTPEQFFNQPMGEWHLTHDQIIFYLKEISKISDRAIIQEYARSYENRPLIHIIFTSKENHKKLEEIKDLHLRLSDPSENITPEEVPMVVNLAYGVHGNESSATNCSVITAYYLAAAQGEKINRLLGNTIILVDPCLNPDGFTRHCTWANMHQSKTGIPDSDSRQFHEVWPGGRTNHYWFDLNRDYLLLVNPESIGRVAKFHEWKPNIYTDHHEMGADNTFFFQPGVPSRNNPLTPAENYRLTNKIAQYHAHFLDKTGSLYFTEENFDDYYLGKGSSYPDINGSIGILFEQAGYRGRIRETANGIRKLAFGIKNQFTVTLSTLEAALNMKNELLKFQKNFYKEALKLADNDETVAYVFGNEYDMEKTQLFIRLLNQHQIKVYENQQIITSNGKKFKPFSSYVVPVRQPQYRLIKSMFEEANSFSDSTFYDVSTWTMPYSFNLPYIKIHSLKNLLYSENPVKMKTLKGEVIGGKSELAYLFRWNEYSAPKVLCALQESELITKVSTSECSFKIDGKEEHFTYGTIMVPVNGQPIQGDHIYKLFSDIAAETGIDIYGMKTGLSPVGIDLGSNNFVTLEKPEILMLTGRSTGSSDAGEIWHLFDQCFNIPLCLADISHAGSIDLNSYNTIILPGGSLSELNSYEINKIKEWTKQGGILIAVKGAAAWAARNDLGKTKFKKVAQPDSAFQLSYAGRKKQQSLNAISGAILNTEIDNTHPLCYGYIQKELSVFKRGSSVAESLNINYSEPVRYTAEPFLSGYISEKNLERIKNAPVISVQSIGKGKLISYHESMTFRGIWLGTNKLFLNSVFFGDVIR